MNKNFFILDTTFMWYLFLLFTIFLLLFIIIYPFLIKFDIRFNILKLKGSLTIKILNKYVIDFKIRIKHGYVYINHKNKERKEKITEKNINVAFILNLIKQLYFREQFLNLEIHSNFGYMYDAMITAVITGFIDVITKSMIGKIKNNKKTAHILIDVKPKYNEDILNIRVQNSVRISIFDILYAFILAKFYVWREYEKSGKSRLKTG